MEKREKGGEEGEGWGRVGWGGGASGWTIDFSGELPMPLLQQTASLREDRAPR